MVSFNAAKFEFNLRNERRYVRQVAVLSSQL
jgi:hypothetical protein